MHNEISGGLFFHAVIQGQNITVELPPEITPALGGLPERSTAFAGREDTLREVLTALDPACPAAEAVPVQALAGLAGVGKSELVKQAAHEALGRPGWFPGGVLFVDLLGYDPARRLDAGEALEGLLRSLGIPAQHIPPRVQDRARLYASVLATHAEQGRRLLIVVDNAGEADQVRPLLPTDGTTRALVTSRRRMGDLDARLHDLDVLDPDASVEVLRRALRTRRGREERRVDDSPQDAAAIAALCGHLPLALWIVAGLLADEPAWPLTGMAAELADEAARLDELRYEDRGVRAAFDLSYDRLEPGQARIFRLMTLNPGPEISTRAAARLADVDERTARRITKELARSHLIRSGSAHGRWRMHDLVRLYATERGEHDSEADDRASSLERLVDHYLGTAQAATGRLNQHVTGDEPAGTFASRQDALAWLDSERDNLTATVHAAAGSHPGAVVALALTLESHLRGQHRHPEWIAVAEEAVTAARRVGDRHDEGLALTSLAGALTGIHAVEEAIEAAQRAVAVLHDVGDRDAEGAALGALKFAFAAARRFGEANDAQRRELLLLLNDPERARKMAGLRTGRGTSLQTEAAAAVDALGAMAAARESGDRDAGRQAQERLNLALSGSPSQKDAAEAIARSLVEAAPTPGFRGKGLLVLAAALRDKGRLDEALVSIDEAISLLRDTPDANDVAHAMAQRAILLRRAGRSDEAVDAYREAAGMFGEVGDRFNEGLARNQLGEVLGGAVRHEEAVEAFRGALDAYGHSGHRLGDTNRRRTLNNLAVALDRTGRSAEAERARGQAADLPDG